MDPEVDVPESWLQRTARVGVSAFVAFAMLVQLSAPTLWMCLEGQAPPPPEESFEDLLEVFRDEAPERRGLLWSALVLSVARDVLIHRIDIEPLEAPRRIRRALELLAAEAPRPEANRPDAYDRALARSAAAALGWSPQREGAWVEALAEGPRRFLADLAEEASQQARNAREHHRRTPYTGALSAGRELRVLQLERAAEDLQRLVDALGPGRGWLGAGVLRLVEPLTAPVEAP